MVESLSEDILKENLNCNMQSTQPKPFVFVLMPFDASFDDIYLVGIKQACTDIGAYSERVDEQDYDGSVLERIYNQISKSDIVIADLTGKNPNVFYETGYAHALGKRVILLTQKANDIPFDLKHYPHIIYEGRIFELKTALQKKLTWALTQPKEKLEKNIFDTIEVFVNGHNVKEEPNIKYQHKNGYLMLDIAIHNNSDILINNALSIGLETSHNLYVDDTSYKSIQLPEQKYLYLSKEIERIYPSAWRQVVFSFDYLHDDLYTFKLSIFTEQAKCSYNFSVLFE
jgi:hypothetical protein